MSNREKLYTDAEDDIQANDPLIRHSVDSPLNATQAGHGHTQKKRFFLATGLNICVFIATCLMWAHTIYMGSTNDLNPHLRAISLYTPLLDKGVPLEPQTDGPSSNELWGEDSTTVLYHEPSLEVDAAWDWLVLREPGSLITITGDEAKRLDRNLSHTVKATEDWGFGNDAYPAQIDVFHEIHCLNSLRKEIHFEYYRAAEFGNRANVSAEHIAHRNHCMRIVLRTLICNTDVQIITQNWLKGVEEPIADFDNPRKCNNYRGLRDWVEKNGVRDPLTKWQALRKPDDAGYLE